MRAPNNWNVYFDIDESIWSLPLVESSLLAPLAQGIPHIKSTIIILWKWFKSLENKIKNSLNVIKIELLVVFFFYLSFHLNINVFYSSICYDMNKSNSPYFRKWTLLVYCRIVRLIYNITLWNVQLSNRIVQPDGNLCLQIDWNK